jgi:hypothetical protein
MRVQDHRKIKPSLLGPNIADVTGPFLVGRVGGEGTIQQVLGDVELVIADVVTLCLSVRTTGMPF